MIVNKSHHYLALRYINGLHHAHGDVIESHELGEYAFYNGGLGVQKNLNTSELGETTVKRRDEGVCVPNEKA